MANPLKVLVDLQARRNVAVSGTLEVTGSTALVGTATITSADINGGTIDNTSIGATTQSSGKFTTISGSSTLDVGGNTTLAGTLGVTGNTTVTSLTASSVISGTAGYFTGLYVNGVAVSTGSGGGSGTVDTGVVNKLAYYSGTTTVNDAAGLTWDGSKLNVSGSSDSALALEVTGSVATSGGLVVNSGGVTINSNTGLVVNSNGITVNSGGASITGLLSANNGLTVSAAALISQNSTVLSGSTTTSGSLTVGGGGLLTANNGVTVNGSAGTFNAGLVVAGGTALNVTGGGGISGSGVLQIAGAASLNAGLTVIGGAVDASAVAVSASALNVTNAATIGGNLTVTGDLQVQGSVNAVNRTDLHVTDKVILVASGSANAAAADGAGLQVYVGDATDPSFTWNSAGKWVSSENLDLASGKTYKINGTDVLTATALGNAVTTSSLTTVGILTSLSASGHTAISTLSASAISGTAGTFTSLSVNGTSISTAVQNAYGKVRHAVTGALDGSTTVDFDLTAVDGTAFAVGQKDYISVNVVVRSGSLGSWQNDLVAVHLSGNTAANGGDDKLHILIDALGSDVTHYRLIAVNESDSAFSVTF